MRPEITSGRYVAAAFAALCLAAVGMGTAQADTTPPTPYLSGTYSSTTLATTSAGKTVDYDLVANAAGVTTFSGITVVYDVSGLAGIATLTPTTGTCTTSGTLITCKVPKFTINQNGGPQDGPLAYAGTDPLPIRLVPVAGAASGATGTVNVTVSSTSPETPATTAPYTVTLGDGPDLVLSGVTGFGVTSVTAKADSTYSRSLSFTNGGDQAAEGVTLDVNTGGYGLDLPETHKNCQYSDAQPEQMTCYFPDLIEPGATENLSAAVKALTYSDLMWQSLQISVQPGYQPPPAEYTNGVGAALALDDSTGAAQVPVTGETPQSNLDEDDFTNLFVTVPTASADVSAVGSIAPASAANQYLVDADVVNNGFGYVNVANGSYILTGTVTFPTGVSVTTVPSSWVPIVNGNQDTGAVGRPGYSEYYFSSTDSLSGGAQADAADGGTLQISVGSGFTGGEGSVSVGVDSESATQFPQLGNIDTNTANDTAAFAIPAYAG